MPERKQGMSRGLIFSLESPMEKLNKYDDEEFESHYITNQSGDVAP
jgi:hypothetical protein